VISLATKRVVVLAFCPLLVSCASHPAASNAQDSSTERQTSPSRGATAAGPRTVFAQENFEFGDVLSGTVVEHDFTVRNIGSAPTRIENVSMTTPLLVTRMPREVVGGQEDRIHFRLDTANLEGKFDGAILVNLSDPALPQARLAFSGHIVPAIEVSPRPAFFVAGQRGKGNQGVIEIVNHESQTLRIEKVEHLVGRFTTKLETLEPGQRYRLTLALKPNGPAGRASETILIRTSSKRMPELKISANTYLYERVHAFPEVLDFGMLGTSEQNLPPVVLMIHQEGGTDFQAQLSTDIPGLRLKTERGPKRDRYQVELSLVPEKNRVGPIKGCVFIDTNDHEFPRVVVPVSGQIVQR
jgi:uncharacterized protein DUF1573